VEDVGCDHAKRHAEDALARQVEMIDDAFPGIAGVCEDARKVLAVDRVGHQDDGDDRQRPADAAPCRLQHQHDHDRAHHPIDGHRIADAELQVMKDPRHVEAGDRRGDGADPVDDAYAERRDQTGLRCRRIALPAPREDKEDEAQHAGDVNAAMRGLRQQAEACGVIVEAGQAKQESRNDRRRCRQQRTKPHLGVELGLEFLNFGLVELGRGRHAVPQQGR
jgi:hypothetical protein